jgi:hypothetical protein
VNTWNVKSKHSRIGMGYDRYQFRGAQGRGHDGQRESHLTAVARDTSFCADISNKSPNMARL